MMTEGGMIGPTMAEEAETAAAKAGSKPSRRIARISTVPSPAASAWATPDMPAKIRLATTFTCASPPRMCPTSAVAKATGISSAIRPKVTTKRSVSSTLERPLGQPQLGLVGFVIEAPPLLHVGFGVDGAAGKRGGEVGHDEIGRREGHRGEPDEEGNRIEPMSADIDRQRDRLAPALHLHDAERVACERQAARAYDAVEEGLCDRPPAGRDAAEERLDPDVPQFLEAERSPEKDRPDEAIGGELLHPDQRLPKQVSRDDLQGDRHDH